MRSSLRLAAVAAICVSAMSCTEAPNGPGSSSLMGRIGIAPSYSTAALAAYNSLAAFAVEVTSVHVHLTAPDGSTRDTTVDFPAGVDELTIDLPVPLRTAGETFTAALELRAADGTVLFSGTQSVKAQSSLTPGGGTIVPVPITYTGPGASAETVIVTPSAGAYTGATTFTVTASGKTAAGAEVPNMLVRWTTSDATLATVNATGNTTATVTTTGKRGTVVISAITIPNKTGTASFAVVPPPSKVVVISGNGQSAPAGTAVAQPLVVEVQASDNLPVPGASVTFRAVTAGASVGVTTPIIADATGRASTTLTVGSTVGAYQFEATSGTLTAATATATATPAPAASITIASGDYQAGAAGATLGQPLGVRVLNRFGAPVAGVTIQWAKVSGGGSLDAATSTSGTDGVATVTYRAGTTPGTENVRAVLPGVLPPLGEAIFTVAVTPGPVSSIAGTGSGQHATAGSALANPLVVTAYDDFGNTVGSAPVSWRVAAGSIGSATFSATSVSTNAGGVAQTNVTLGSAAGSVTITATVGAVSFNFTVTADAASNGGSPGTLSGYVYNAVNNSALPGATVYIVVSGNSNTESNASRLRMGNVSRAMQQCQQCGVTVVTGSDGHFTSPLLASGTYTVSVSLSGYTSTVINAQSVNGNTVAEAVPLVPASSVPGSIAGTIRDATSSSAIGATATVELRAGLNASTGTPIQTVSTNGSGQYVFSNVSAGTYTVRSTAAGYTSAIKTGISVGEQTTGNQDIFMSPTGAAGSVRIVLTWLSSPSDLDSHLTGPQGSSRFHVYYSSTGNCNGTPFACLDHDVTSGFGPETMTISQPQSGVYRYSVQNYSCCSNGSSTSNLGLSTSAAHVAVYINNVLAQTFSVPSGAGSLWTVFELNGTTITPINQISGGNVFSTSRIPTSGARESSAPTQPTDADVIRRDGARHPKRP